MIKMSDSRIRPTFWRYVKILGCMFTHSQYQNKRQPENIFRLP
ncbi:hypothetical protein ACKLNO_09300 [Neisseriaceae bacterium B1]